MENYDIIWNDRGIIIILIEYILKNFNNLKNKNIIIENVSFLNLFKSLFRNLKFTSYTKHSKSNFYFNIKRIIKHQDLIIDEIDNYNKKINGENIVLVPWTDKNNFLILYEYSNKQVNLESYRNKFNLILNNRYQFNGYLWDLLREKEILNVYQKYNSNFSWDNLFRILNTYFRKTNNYIIKNKYIPIMINSNTQSSNNTIEIKKDKLQCKECPKCNSKTDNKDLESIKCPKCEDKSDKYLNVIKLLSEKIKLINENIL